MRIDNACSHADDKTQDFHVLASTVHSSLQKAADAGIKSVATPLIGSGNAGWPVELAAEVLVAAALTFMQLHAKCLAVADACGCQISSKAQSRQHCKVVT